MGTYSKLKRFEGGSIGDYKGFRDLGLGFGVETPKRGLYMGAL